MTPVEGKEWDDFVRTLRPAPANEMLKRLAGFRFTTDPAKKGEEESRSLAETPVRLIGSGLTIEASPPEEGP